MFEEPGLAVRSCRWLAAAAILFFAGLAHSSGPALERHVVIVDDHPVTVWAKRPPEARRAILLVHGRTWSTLPDFDLQVAGESLSLMDGLAAMNLAVYGVDLRGYGATPRDGSGWLTPERAAADAGAVLAWIRARHPYMETAPVLFGWSYGAMVAQLTAQRTPERLGALVLFGYPVRPGITVNPDTDTPPRRPTTAEGAAEDFILPGTISQAAIDAFVASALAHDPVRMDWRRLEQWELLDGAEVTVPTLLLQAQHDPYVVGSVHAELFDRLATADKAWAVIPDADHAAFMETARSYFLALIESFVFRR